jgi:hypothetical protein
VAARKLSAQKAINPIEGYDSIVSELSDLIESARPCLSSVGQRRRDGDLLGNWATHSGVGAKGARNVLDMAKLFWKGWPRI